MKVYKVEWKCADGSARATWHPEKRAAVQFRMALLGDGKIRRLSDADIVPHEAPSNKAYLVLG